MRTTNLLASLVVFGLLAGCSPTPAQKTDLTQRFDLSGDFADCRVARFISSSDGGGGIELYAMRCPNSITSVDYATGKTHRRVVTVDAGSEVPSSASAPVAASAPSAAASFAVTAVEINGKRFEVATDNVKK